MSTGDKLDLNQLVANRQLSAELKTPETFEELQARLEREKEDSAHQRHVFWAMFALLVSVASIAVLLLTLSDNMGNQEWARTALSAIIGGIVGYVTGSRVIPAK